jgi:hypothetical protein
MLPDKLLSALRKISFKNIPISVKLFLGFGFVFFTMVLLLVITFTFYSNEKQTSTLSVIQQMNNQTINKIDEYMKDLSSITKLPIFFNEITEENFLRELYLFNETNESSFNLQKLAEQVAYKVFNYKTHIHSIFFLA